MKNFLKKYVAEIVLGILVVSYAAYFSYFTILRHQTLYSGYFDLGIMNQAVFNTFRGNFLEITNPEGLENFKRMAIHNDLILALITPFYYIHLGPETLLVVQSVIIALGAILLYLLAKSKLKSKILALTFSFSYLMFMPLQRSNIFDFHSVTLAVTFLLTMFYFADKKKYLSAFVFLLLSLMTKEQVGLTTSFYAVYLFLDKQQKSKKFAWIVLLTSISWFVLSIWVVMPYFRQGQHFALSYYGDFGNKPEKVFLGIFTQPQKFASYFLQPSSFIYLFYLLFPVAFLPVFCLSILLIPLPEFAINFLSNNANMQNIALHYSAIFIPFVFIAAVFGAKKILIHLHFLSAKKIALIVFITSLLSAYLFGPLPLARNQDIYPFLWPRSEVKHLAYWKDQFKNENLIISASDSLGAHFTNRRYFIFFPNIISRQIMLYCVLMI